MRAAYSFFQRLFSLHGMHIRHGSTAFMFISIKKGHRRKGAGAAIFLFFGAVEAAEGILPWHALQLSL